MVNHYTDTSCCRSMGLEGVFEVTSNCPFNVNETFCIYLAQIKHLNTWQIDYLIAQVAYWIQAVFWQGWGRFTFTVKGKGVGWICMLATNKCVIHVMFRRFHFCYIFLKSMPTDKREVLGERQYQLWLIMRGEERRKSTSILSWPLCR